MRFRQVRIFVIFLAAAFCFATAVLAQQGPQTQQAQQTVQAVPNVATKSDIGRVEHNLNQLQRDQRRLLGEVGQTQAEARRQAKAERQAQEKAAAQVAAAHVADATALTALQRTQAEQHAALEQAARNLRLELAAAALALMFCGTLLAWWIRKGRNANVERSASLPIAKEKQGWRLPLNPTQEELRRRAAELGVSEIKFTLTSTPGGAPFSPVEVTAVIAPEEIFIFFPGEDRRQAIAWKYRRKAAASQCFATRTNGLSGHAETLQ